MPAQAYQPGPVRIEGWPIDTVFTEGGYRYQIILRGECGPLIAGLFGDTAIECGHGRTRLIAAVRDDSGLYGLLDRIQDLALHLVSLKELDGAEGADAQG